MTSTTRLAMPLIAAEQTQKHVTHNEALLVLDSLVQLRLNAIAVSEPPTSPQPGEAFAVGPDAIGAWTGKDGQIACWTLGGWRFMTPSIGWLGWNDDKFVVFDGSEWRDLHANLHSLGVGTEPDAINRLAVRTEAALFTAVPALDGGNGDVRLTLNREADTDSATVIFQSGWSGRAEIGLAGNDDFAFKVSADGAAWNTAITLGSEIGFVRLDQMFGAAVSFPIIADGLLAVTTSHAVPAPESGAADDVESIDGGADGALLVITGTDDIALTFRNGTANLRLGGDRVLSSAADSLVLVRRGSNWIELSYAANG